MPNFFFFFFGVINYLYIKLAMLRSLTIIEAHQVAFDATLSISSE